MIINLSLGHLSFISLFFGELVSVNKKLKEFHVDEQNALLKNSSSAKVFLMQ